MIEQLIDLFDAAVTAPVATKHGLAILSPDGPMKRTQAGQYTPIAVDNEAPWSYWRIGDIRSTPYDIYACSMGALQQVPLRLVLLLPNDCGHRDILLAAGRSVTATTGAAKELLGAARVRVVGQRIAVDGVGQAEKTSDIPLQWSLIAIDMDLEVIGTADCLVGCGEGPSVLCSVITTATNAEVVECLGDRINEICESGPSDPVTVANSDGSYAVEVDCGEGLILPDVTNTDSDGTPVTLPAQTPFVATPCGPSGDGYVQLYDDAATPNPIGSLVTVPSGSTVPVTAPHGTVKTSDGSVSVMDVLSGGAANLPQSIIRYVDAAGAGATTPAADTRFSSSIIYREGIISRRELKDSTSTGIGIYATLDRLIDDTIPDIPDSAITLPNAVVVNVKATQPYTVPQTAPLKFAFGPYDQGSDVWTVTADEAGQYDAYTQDGASGTITYSLNGGAFVALSGTITLAIADTLQTKRTTYTAAGWSRWERLVTP